MPGEQRDAEREPALVRFRTPYCRPGTPEAHRHGCLCSFESNINASLLAAEREPGMAYLVIHKDCPLHEIIPGTLDDAVDLDER